MGSIDYREAHLDWVGVITRARKGERVEVTREETAPVYVVPWCDIEVLQDYELELDEKKALEELNQRRKRLRLWSDLRAKLKLPAESGPWEVKLSAQAAEDFRDFYGDEKQEIGKHIDGLSREPRPDGVVELNYGLCWLKLEEPNRIVYQFSPKASTVTIANLGHYRNMYRGYKPRYRV